MSTEPKCWSAKRTNRRTLIAVLVLLFSVVNARCATDSATARKCGADLSQPPHSVLADSEGSGKWQKYEKTADIPDLTSGGGGPGGAAAVIWRGSEGKILILLEEASEDWDTYTEYCFGPNGQLWLVRYELRTAWGWGFHEEGSIVKGKLHVDTSVFFSTENERPISKPELADDIPDALKPDLYLNESELPFSKLLAGAKEHVNERARLLSNTALKTYDLERKTPFLRTTEHGSQNTKG